MLNNVVSQLSQLSSDSSILWTVSGIIKMTVHLDFNDDVMLKIKTEIK
jgi:hypothetical protein